MVVIDVTPLRERAHIGPGKSVHLYSVQRGWWARSCIQYLNMYRKLTRAVQNSAQCFLRNLWSVALRASRTRKSRHAHHRGHRGIPLCPLCVLVWSQCFRYFGKKSRPLRGRLWAAWLAKSSGEEG